MTVAAAGLKRPNNWTVGLVTSCLVNGSAATIGLVVKDRVGSGKSFQLNCDARL